jgi:hypothetical protein
MQKPTLVVLAAGIGRRYGGLKQVDPVGPNSELILDYSVYDALQAGFEAVVFVIRPDMEEAFRQQIGRNVEGRCQVRYVFQRLDDVPVGFEVPPERQKPWGTGQATLSCRDVVHTPFAVINADDLYGRSAYQALATYLRGAQDRDGRYDYCMVGYPVENTLSEYGHVSRGVCRLDQEGYLVEIHERTRVERSGDAARYTEDGEHWLQIPRGTPVSMNLWGFTPSLFSELDARFRCFLQEKRTNLLSAEFYLPEVVGALVREGRATVRVLPSTEQWFGITYQEDRPRVEKAIRDLIHQGVYPEKLWA